MARSSGESEKQQISAETAHKYTHSITLTFNSNNICNKKVCSIKALQTGSGEQLSTLDTNPVEFWSASCTQTSFGSDSFQMLVLGILQANNKLKPLSENIGGSSEQNMYSECYQHIETMNRLYRSKWTRRVTSVQHRLGASPQSALFGS